MRQISDEYPKNEPQSSPTAGEILTLSAGSGQLHGWGKEERHESEETQADIHHFARESESSFIISLEEVGKVGDYHKGYQTLITINKGENFNGGGGGD